MELHKLVFLSTLVSTVQVEAHLQWTSWPLHSKDHLPCLQLPYMRTICSTLPWLQLSAFVHQDPGLTACQVHAMTLLPFIRGMLEKTLELWMLCEQVKQLPEQPCWLPRHTSPCSTGRQQRVCTEQGLGLLLLAPPCRYLVPSEQQALADMSYSLYLLLNLTTTTCTVPNDQEMTAACRHGHAKLNTAQPELEIPLGCMCCVIMRIFHTVCQRKLHKTSVPQHAPSCDNAHMPTIPRSQHLTHW